MFYLKKMEIMSYKKGNSNSIKSQAFLTFYFIFDKIKKVFCCAEAFHKC